MFCKRCNRKCSSLHKTYCDRIASRQTKRFAVDEERDAYKEKTVPAEPKIPKISERQAAKMASKDAVPLGSKITWKPKSRVELVEIETNLLQPDGNKVTLSMCDTCLAEKKFRCVYSLDKKYTAIQLVLCDRCLALNGKK